MDSAMLIPPASWAGWGEDTQQPAGDSPIGTAVVVVEAAVGETAVVEVEDEEPAVVEAAVETAVEVEETAVVERAAEVEATAVVEPAAEQGAEQAAGQAAGAENPSRAAEQAAEQAAGQGTEDPSLEQLEAFKQQLEQAAKDKIIKDKEIAALEAQTGKETFVKHLQAQIWLYSTLLILYQSIGTHISMHDFTDSS